MKKHINTKVKLGMKKIKVPFTIISIISIINTSYSQVRTFYVRPYQTDTLYSILEDSSFVAKNALADKNTLFLFLGGGFSHPNSYWGITYFSATHGYDAISLCYSNQTGAGFFTNNPDSTFFSKFRQELCFGTPVCDSISVDTLHSINIRLRKLLKYLEITYPSDNWGQYLTINGEPDWQKIILAGHSLGSGNALYIAKQFETKGVLMFAGPNDYSTYYTQPAPWLSIPGLTGLEKHFSYLSFYDEVVSYDKQYSNINALGMLENDDSTFVDFILPPYNNSHCLYTKQDPGLAVLYHNTPTMNSSINHNVWEYMLNCLSDTSSSIVKDGDLNSFNWSVYPNPTNGTLNININSNPVKFYVSIFNLLGKKVFSAENRKNLNLNGLPSGTYILSLKINNKMETRKILKIE